MRKLTHKEYVTALRGKGISLTPLDTYNGRDSRLRFKCPKNHVSIIRAGMLLNPTVIVGCRACRYAEKRKSLPQYEKDLKLAYGGDIAVIGKVYTNAMTKITHQCTRCKHTWDVTPNDILSRKSPCKFCDGKHLTETKVRERLSVNPKVKFISYVGGDMVTVRCVDCNHLWNALLTNLTANLTGCYNCSRDSYNRYKKKEVKIGRRVLTLQGYEEYAVRWLLKFEDLKLKELAFTPAEGKPIVKYKFGKDTKRYFPDFYIPRTNTIIEVKSEYTLGITHKSPTRCLMLVKAKARACIREGYEFRLMLMCNDGSLIPLPTDWISKTKRDLMQYVNTR